MLPPVIAVVVERKLCLVAVLSHCALVRGMVVLFVSL
jgi:hypothetical protein